MLAAALWLLAQEEKTATPRGPGMEILFMPLIILALAYFLLIRPQQRWKEQQEDEARKDVKKNDKVIVLNYLYGQVVSVHDTEDEMVVKLDENLRLKMAKGAVTKNFTRDERLKAAQEAKPGAAAAAETKDKVTPK